MHRVNVPLLRRLFQKRLALLRSGLAPANKSLDIRCPHQPLGSDWELGVVRIRSGSLVMWPDLASFRALLGVSGGCQNQLTLHLYQKFKVSEFHDLGFFEIWVKWLKMYPFN